MYQKWNAGPLIRLCLLLRTSPGVDFRDNLIALDIDLGETRVATDHSVLKKLGQSDDENL
jgi:hypothetical protein